MVKPTPSIDYPTRNDEPVDSQPPAPVQGSTSVSSTGLLRTKLYLPHVRSVLVSRPHLVKRLKQGLSHKLTLISAPPGFGKTTLLSEWTPSSACPVAWVSLDEADNDPIRFWSYIITAIRMVDARVGTSALGLLQSSQRLATELILTTLVNEIDAFSGDLAIVLDDYHLIDSQDIHRSMIFFLDRLPSRIHLVLTSRSDPPLEISLLRARGELIELRAADLRFTTEEAARFLNEQMGLDLSPGDVAALETRTEGWIAGLQLAALSMRGRQDLHTFVTAFSGSHRFILDYLVDQVLQRQSSDIQDFMLGTSVLERMCAGLCEAVTGRRDSQAVLEQLDSRNLFFVPMDDERRWYRYHHLFADVLRSRLGAEQSGRIPVLHRRASEWFEQQELMAEAIDYALAGADLERATRLIEQNGYPIMLRGRVRTVLNWLGSIPIAWVDAHPRLGSIYATALMFANQPEAAEERLRAAESSVASLNSTEEMHTILGLVAVNRGNIALRFPGDLASSVQLAQHALELLPSTERIAVATARVLAAHDFLVSGDVGPANERMVKDVLAAARASENLFAILRSLVLLARLKGLQGRLREAALMYEPVAQLAPGGIIGPVGTPGYYIGQGDLLREWNDLDEAERHLAQGLDLVKQNGAMDAEMVTWGSIALARTQWARGDVGGARATLTEFLELASRREFAVPLITRGQAAQAQIELACGNRQAALQWQKTAEVSLDDESAFSREAEYLTLVRVLVATGQAAGALRLIDRLLPVAQSKSRMSSVIEILILRALGLQSEKGVTPALSNLEQAMALAQSEGYVRIFVDEGEPMRVLLRQAASRGVFPDYVLTLLRAAGSGLKDTPPATKTSGLAEPLSERELEVLRLIAQGASNREIADTLVIAVATVKRHLNNIYGKLGVASRTQAIALARALKLI